MAVLPDALVRSCARYVHDGNPLPMRRAVDRLVTTPYGYLTLVKAGYLGPHADWDVASMAADLADATARLTERHADDPAIVERSARVAERAAAIAQLVGMPGSAERDASIAKLSPIEVGRPPFRPIRVPVTKHPQHDLVLDVDGPVRVRFVDVAPAGHQHVVLLVHGHSSRIEEYDALIEALTPACRVIVCDLPGCGYSEHPDREYRLAWYERVLLALLDARQVPQCVVAGGSLGGNLALRLGLCAPSRFRKIAAWAPAGWWKTDPVLAAGARLLDEATFWSSLRIQAESWWSRSDPSRFARIEDAIEYRVEVFGPGFLRAYKDIAWEQCATSMFSHADDLTVPTLLCVGKDDHSLDMRNGVVQLSKTIPRATLVEYAGAHSIADEHTGDLAARLIAFAGA
ncbi:MAG: alpha/beta hydrolase [Myxococcota bacterium]|nr:alpha/beta hydrolase [Myxococcota bacterium]